MMSKAILKVTQTIKRKRLRSLTCKKDKRLTSIICRAPINQLEKNKQYSRKMGKS